jgi:hypothetical protein
MTETATGPTDRWTLADWELRMCQPPRSVFTDHELDGYPPPSNASSAQQTGQGRRW